VNQEEQNKKISQLIAKCWTDEGFKRKVLTDAAATLKAEGLELPAGVNIKVLENTDKVFHLIIPAKPTELSDQELDQVAGGLRRLADYSSCGPPVEHEQPHQQNSPGPLSVCSF
jgi:hypothetical protein